MKNSVSPDSHRLVITNGMVPTLDNAGYEVPCP